MKLPLRSLTVTLCALFPGAGFAQSAVTSAVTTAPGMTFSYEAQHNQVVANGVQLKPAAIGAASLSQVIGTVVVTISITDLSHFTRGTTYHCSLTAIGGELDLTNSVVSGGVETASGLARWTGSNMLSCTLRIPYEWTLVSDSAATRGALLAFAVAAVDPNGAVERSTLQVDGVEPLPASGTTSTFAFGVTL